MAKYAKNVSGSSKTWVGQEIANAAYYLIEQAEAVRWGHDSTVITDIGSGDLVIAKDDSGTEDIADVATALDWLRDESDPRDVDGAPITRTKITKSGWHYQLHAVEFTTSKLNALCNQNCQENDLGFVSVKYYDSNEIELTAGTQLQLDTSCVKTVIDWEPTEDIELLGGTLYQGVTPTGNIRLWVTAIPDLTVQQGGSIPFVQGGLNLKQVGTGRVAELDGRTPKLLPYSAVNHTNKLRFILRHDTGGQHTVFVGLELYRANV